MVYRRMVYRRTMKKIAEADCGRTEGKLGNEEMQTLDFSDPSPIHVLRVLPTMRLFFAEIHSSYLKNIS